MDYRIFFDHDEELISKTPKNNSPSSTTKNSWSKKTPWSTTLSVNKDELITKLEIACKLSLPEIKIYIEQAKQKQEEEGIAWEEDTEESR